MSATHIIDPSNEVDSRWLFLEISKLIIPNQIIGGDVYMCDKHIILVAICKGKGREKNFVTIFYGITGHVLSNIRVCEDNDELVKKYVKAIEPKMRKSAKKTAILNNAITWS